MRYRRSRPISLDRSTLVARSTRRGDGSRRRPPAAHGDLGPSDRHFVLTGSPTTRIHRGARPSRIVRRRARVIGALGRSDASPGPALPRSRGRSRGPHAFEPPLSCAPRTSARTARRTAEKSGSRRSNPLTPDSLPCACVARIARSGHPPTLGRRRRRRTATAP